MATEVAPTPQKRGLDGRVLAEVESVASSMADPTPRAVRRRVEASLGMSEGGLDEHRDAIRDVLVDRASAANATAPGGGNPQNVDDPNNNNSNDNNIININNINSSNEAVEGDEHKDGDENGSSTNSTKMGKFSDRESRVLVGEAERVATALGLELGQLLDGEWKDRVDKGHNVWRDIAERASPRRTGQSVYGHVRRVCDARRRKGRWTPADTDELARLHSIHGAQWQKISAEIGRTAGSCRDRFRTVFGEPSNLAKGGVREQFAHGEWTEEEVERLRRTNCNGVPIVDVADPAQISWTQLSQRVRSRGRQACRRKWAELRDLKQGGRKFLAHEQLVAPAQLLELCDQLQRTKARDESEVVWTDLGWDRRGCATAVALKRWKALKAKHPTLSFRAALTQIIHDLREEVNSKLMQNWGEVDDPTADGAPSTNNNNHPASSHHHLQQQQQQQQQGTTTVGPPTGGPHATSGNGANVAATTAAAGVGASTPGLPGDEGNVGVKKKATLAPTPAPAKVPLGAKLTAGAKATSTNPNGTKRPAAAAAGPADDDGRSEPKDAADAAPQDAGE